MATAARCPQWWMVIAVPGSTGIHQVVCDDISAGILRCSCPALASDRTPCRHIRLVLDHGCFGGGPNNLAQAGITVTGMHPTRGFHGTGQRCACGEQMLAQAIRLIDEDGRQIVRVRFGGRGPEYSYACRRTLAVGDRVLIGGTSATVSVPETVGP
jgi:hypothetical protein